MFLVHRAVSSFSIALTATFFVLCFRHTTLSCAKVSLSVFSSFCAFCDPPVCGCGCSLGIIVSVLDVRVVSPSLDRVLLMRLGAFVHDVVLVF